MGDKTEIGTDLKVSMEEEGRHADIRDFIPGSGAGHTGIWI